MADITLDCRNLNCPMPIVKIAKTIRDMQISQTLEVTATDPAFRADVEAWVRKTGHLLIKFDDGAEKRVILQKTA